MVLLFDSEKETLQFFEKNLKTIDIENLHHETISEIVSRGFSTVIEFVFLNSKNNYYNSFHFCLSACKQKDLEILKQLFLLDCDVERFCKNNYFDMICAACRFGNVEIAEFFLDNFSHNLKEMKSYIFIANFYNQKKVLQFLLNFEFERLNF
jgi:hypothetical protein